MGDWHMCEGTIDMEAYTGTYTAIKMMSFMGSQWLLDRIDFFYLSHTRLYREYITSSEMYYLHLTHPK